MYIMRRGRPALTSHAKAVFKSICKREASKVLSERLVCYMMCTQTCLIIQQEQLVAQEMHFEAEALQTDTFRLSC